MVLGEEQSDMSLSQYSKITEIEDSSLALNSLAYLIPHIQSTCNSLETKLSQKLGPSRTWVERDGEVAPAQELMEMNKIQVYYTVATRQMTSVIQQLKQVTQVGR